MYLRTDQINYQFSSIEIDPIYHSDDFKLNLSTSMDIEEINQPIEEKYLTNKMNIENQNQYSENFVADQNEILFDTPLHLNSKRKNLEDSVTSSELFLNSTENCQEIMTKFDDKSQSYLTLGKNKYNLFENSSNQINNEEGGLKRIEKLKKKENEKLKRKAKEKEKEKEKKQGKEKEKEKEMKKDKEPEKEKQIEKEKEEISQIENMKDYGEEKEKSENKETQKSIKREITNTINQNQKNYLKVANKHNINNNCEFDECEEPKEGNDQSENIMNIIKRLNSEKCQNKQTCINGQDLLLKTKLVNNVNAQRIETNTNSVNTIQKSLTHKNINSTLNINVSSLSLTNDSRNLYDSINYTPHTHSFLSASEEKSGTQSEIRTEILQDEESKCNILESHIAFSNSITNQKEYKKEVVNKNADPFELILCKPEPKTSKKSILSHLFGLIAVYFEWEKTFQNHSENSKLATFKTYLIHNFLKVTPAFWDYIKSDSRFSFCKANFYSTNQYIKFYIWMRCIIEIQNNYITDEEASAFLRSIPLNYYSKILAQEEFIKTMIQGIAVKSFNQFIINVDLVFAYPIEMDEFQNMNGAEQKKFLKDKFYKEKIDKYRKTITKDNFFNKVYLSLMNELIIRSIYPEILSKISLEDENNLPIEMLISKKIADSIT